MLTLVVQAGGESHRMGSDKGLLTFLHQPLIQRVAERLAPLADEVLVTTNHGESYRFLGLPLFPDVIPGRGALGGLYTALQSASHPLVAIVACDMPFASLDLFEYLLRQMVELEVDVAIPSNGQGGALEPLHAIYRRETCLPAARAALQHNAWKMISWFPQVKVHCVPPAIVARFDLQQRIFMNVNTPADLRAAERIARAESGSIDP